MHRHRSECKLSGSNQASSAQQTNQVEMLCRVQGILSIGLSLATMAAISEQTLSINFALLLLYVESSMAVKQAFTTILYQNSNPNHFPYFSTSTIFPLRLNKTQDNNIVIEWERC